MLYVFVYVLFMMVYHTSQKTVLLSAYTAAVEYGLQRVRVIMLHTHLTCRGFTVKHTGMRSNTP